MSGNVNEWVNDWYTTYGSAAAIDPEGPTSATYTLLRGGGWFNTSELRGASRSTNVPSFQSWGVGFRVARTVP